MIDIHTHILPNVDDGATSLDVSLKLLDLEIKNGIDHCILTPHMNELNKDKSAILKAYNLLLESTKKLPIKLTLGSEIYYYPNMVKDLENNILLPIGNTRYILVEFSTREKTNIPDIVYDLSIKGYKPIVAHIERYDYLTASDYFEIKKYAKIQINAGSFNHKEYKKILKLLLKENLVDFLASDCHDLDKRSVDFTLAKKKISKYSKVDITENGLEL